MAKFSFRNPALQRRDPFTDGAGKNPFGDDAKSHIDESSQESAEDNLYAATAGESGPSYRPGDYQAMLAGRSGPILFFAGCGGTLTLIGVSMALAGIATGSDTTLYTSVPVLFLGLSAALPAWIMGSSDLRAVRSGAQDQSELARTRWGTRIGMLAVIIGCLPAIFGFGHVLMLIFGSLGG